jgi:hypothetical protein
VKAIGHQRDSRARVLAVTPDVLVLRAISPLGQWLILGFRKTAVTQRDYGVAHQQVYAAIPVVPHTARIAEHDHHWDKDHHDGNDRDHPLGLPGDLDHPTGNVLRTLGHPSLLVDYLELGIHLDHQEDLNLVLPYPKGTEDHHHQGRVHFGNEVHIGVRRSVQRARIVVKVIANITQKRPLAGEQYHHPNNIHQLMLQFETLLLHHEDHLHMCRLSIDLA